MRKTECDKPYVNTMEIKNINRKQRMKEIRKNVDYGDGTIQVVLQFPDESQDTAMVQDAVRSILMMELQEQIKKFAG